MWLFVWIGACVQTPGVREPEPYLPSTEVQPLEPELSGEEVATVVIDLLQDVPGMVPAGLPDALATLMTHADGDCPKIEAVEEGGVRLIVWYDDCVTSSGAQFSGGFEWRQRTDVVGHYGEVTSGFEFYSQDLWIDTPDGRSLRGGGYFAASHTDGKGYSQADSYASGQLLADPATAGTDRWLSGEVSGNVGVYVASWGGYPYMYVNGSWPLEGDGPLVGVAVQELSIEPGQCENEPLGTIAVREAGGVWHDVSFAFYDEEAEELIGCDGCGAHLAAGVPQGEAVCFSSSELSSIVDFAGGLPW